MGTKKVLITGASGFLGRQILPFLGKKDYEIFTNNRVCSSKKDCSSKCPPLCSLKFEERNLNDSFHNIFQYSASQYNCDILNKQAVSDMIKEIKPDFLIHFAWYAEHGKFWWSPNVISFIDATSHLYEEFSKSGGKKAIFIGTGFEYDMSQEGWIEDKTPLSPSTLYGLSKKQTYEILKMLRVHNPDFYSEFVWARVFWFFGPYETPTRLVPTIIRSYKNNEVPKLVNPNLKHYFCYTENVVKSLVDVLEKPIDGALNICAGKTISLMELTKKIRDMFFESALLPQSYGQDNCYNECKNGLFPNSAKFDSLNIELPYSFEEGLKKTFNFMN